jgi:PII-like signaling protein
MSWGRPLPWPRSKSSSTATRSQPCKISSSKPAPPATRVSGVSGFGHHGRHQGRLLFNGRASLSMLITVVPEDKVPSLVTGLRRLLEDRHGVFFVTQIRVSRPHYFR